MNDNKTSKNFAALPTSIVQRTALSTASPFGLLITAFFIPMRYTATKSRSIKYNCCGKTGVRNIPEQVAVSYLSWLAGDSKTPVRSFYLFLNSGAKVTIHPPSSDFFLDDTLKECYNPVNQREIYLILFVSPLVKHSKHYFDVLSSGYILLKLNISAIFKSYNGTIFVPVFHSLRYTILT